MPVRTTTTVTVFVLRDGRVSVRTKVRSGRGNDAHSILLLLAGGSSGGAAATPR